MLAQRKGFFKEEGIDAEIIRIPSPASLAALVNGDIDYYSAISPVVAAAVRGLPVKVVACYKPGSSNALVARPEFKSVKKLKGKTVAVSTPGGGPTFITKRVLKYFGLDPEKDVKLLSLGGDERRLLALKQGLADAVPLSPPFDYLAKKEGFVVLARADELFSYPLAGLATSVKKIREMPEQVKRVIEAGIKANRDIKQNRNGTIRFMMEWLKINKELATATYEGIWKAFNEDGNIPDDGLRIVIDDAKKANKIDRQISFNDVEDLTILREAQEELGIR